MLHSPRLPLLVRPPAVLLPCKLQRLDENAIPGRCVAQPAPHTWLLAHARHQHPARTAQSQGVDKAAHCKAAQRLQRTAAASLGVSQAPEAHHTVAGAAGLRVGARVGGWGRCGEGSAGFGGWRGWGSRPQLAAAVGPESQSKVSYRYFPSFLQRRIHTPQPQPQPASNHPMRSPRCRRRGTRPPRPPTSQRRRPRCPPPLPPRHRPLDPHARLCTRAGRRWLGGVRRELCPTACGVPAVEHPTARCTLSWNKLRRAGWLHLSGCPMRMASAVCTLLPIAIPLPPSAIPHSAIRHPPSPIPHSAIHHPPSPIPPSPLPSAPHCERRLLLGGRPEGDGAICAACDPLVARQVAAALDRIAVAPADNRRSRGGEVCEHRVGRNKL